MAIDLPDNVAGPFQAYTGRDPNHSKPVLYDPKTGKVYPVYKFEIPWPNASIPESS